MNNNKTEHDISPMTGLGDSEAKKRLEKYGLNAIEEKEISAFRRLLAFFWGPIPWMIEVAAILAFIAQDYADFGIILTLLFFNVGIGFVEEYKANNAIKALKANLALQARVLRDGAWKTIEAKFLVPDDIVMLALGNIIPADVKLVEGDYLSIDQSALTGESLPVDKKIGDTAYSGSIVKQGAMKAIVTATGSNAYFGKTAKLTAQAGNISHYQKAVLKIGNFLMLMTLLLVLVVIVVSMFRGDPLLETLLFALILTVAAIPVALPAVLSVTMAVGASKLAKHKCIVSRLVAIEEMAGMDVLCSDKTGTLTKNILEIGDVFTFGKATQKEVLLTAALASRQEQDGDAIDTAILGGIRNMEELAPYKIKHFTPFDPIQKYAKAIIAKEDGAEFQVAKGAPQAILSMAAPAQELKNKIEEAVNNFAEKGYRTLGVAKSDDGENWEFLGLVPLFDPPRDDSAQMLKEAREHGVDVKMITGDHSAIARELATKLGLSGHILSASEAFSDGNEANVLQHIDQTEGFAEVYPEHKYKIVQALQQHNHIVGMTGDGVNDAPALKQADIGIAVSGATDAARAASDLVLTLPGLSTIIYGIEEARRIFMRMKSYSVFRIAETIRVLIFMTLCITVFNFYPVTAVMIVLLAILNDFPIMMIAYDNTSLPDKPVRWDMAEVLTLSTLLGTLGVISSFSLFWYADEILGLPREIVQTLVFLKLLVAGHMTLYITRAETFFWQRPWPNWRLFVATETTQIAGTLAAVYGWFMPAIGWEYALAVWGYAIAWFLLNNIIKVFVMKMLNRTEGATI